MQIVIEISEEDRKDICNIHFVHEDLKFKIGKSIMNGTPLPDHHGDLIDRNKLIKQYGLENATKYGNKDAEQQRHSYSTMMMYEIADMIDDAPTIIPATKEGDGND